MLFLWFFGELKRLRGNKLIKAIFFDFDGVILDDAEVKDNAFYDLFPEEFSSILNPIIDAYMKQSRKIIIRKCIEEVESKGLFLPNDYDYYLNKFSEITQEKVLNSSELLGASDSLNSLKEKFDLFVLTATPDEQIDEVIKKRGFTQFKEVHGSDLGTKPEVALKLIERYSLKPSEVIFVGDGKNDLACAKKLGFIFIGIVNSLNDFSVNPNIKYKMNDLIGLVDLIERIEEEL